jgi:hypothetical protein
MFFLQMLSWFEKQTAVNNNLGARLVSALYKTRRRDLVEKVETLIC